MRATGQRLFFYVGVENGFSLLTFRDLPWSMLADY
jgi:hypothetical protein